MSEADSSVSIDSDCIEEGLALMGDFGHLNSTLSQDEFMLPMDYLIKHKLEINKWKNIPIPLANACKTFEVCFYNISRFMKLLKHDYEKKTTQQTKMFKMQAKYVRLFREQTIKRVDSEIAHMV